MPIQPRDDVQSLGVQRAVQDLGDGHRHGGRGRRDGLERDRVDHAPADGVEVALLRPDLQQPVGEPRQPMDDDWKLDSARGCGCILPGPTHIDWPLTHLNTTVDTGHADGSGVAAGDRDEYGVPSEVGGVAGGERARVGRAGRDGRRAADGAQLQGAAAVSQSVSLFDDRPQMADYVTHRVLQSEKRGACQPFTQEREPRRSQQISGREQRLATDSHSSSLCTWRPEERLSCR